MDQLFIDKISTMVADNKTVTQAIKTLSDMGSPDSALDIIDVYCEKKQEYADLKNLVEESATPYDIS